VISIGCEEYEEALRLFTNKKGAYIDCKDVEKLVEQIAYKTTIAVKQTTDPVIIPIDGGGNDAYDFNVFPHMSADMLRKLHETADHHAQDIANVVPVEDLEHVAF
jgi:hypothetical protein